MIRAVLRDTADAGPGAPDKGIQWGETKVIFNTDDKKNDVEAIERELRPAGRVLRIWSVDAPWDALNGYLHGGKPLTLQEQLSCLYELDRQGGRMSITNLCKLYGALWINEGGGPELNMEHGGNLRDALALIGRMRDYELLRNVNTVEQMGEFLVRQGVVDVPAAYHKYLDYAKVADHAVENCPFGPSPSGYVCQSAVDRHFLDARQSVVTLVSPVCVLEYQNDEDRMPVELALEDFLPYFEALSDDMAFHNEAMGAQGLMARCAEQLSSGNTALGQCMQPELHKILQLRNVYSAIPRLAIRDDEAVCVTVCKCAGEPSERTLELLRQYIEAQYLTYYPPLSLRTGSGYLTANLHTPGMASAMGVEVELAPDGQEQASMTLSQ